MAKPEEEVILTIEKYINGVWVSKTAECIPPPPNYFLWALFTVGLPVGLWFLTMQDAFRLY